MARASWPVAGALLVGVVALAGRAALRRWAEAASRRPGPVPDGMYEMPADVVHHHLESGDGGSIHLVERGSGRPLLLIHGVTLQAGVWAPQLHQLADRYRVMALDVRGHGGSTPGRDGVGRRQAARDLATVIEHFDLRDLVAVGHSMGGMILMELARETGQEMDRRVAGLVLMGTVAYEVVPGVALPVARALGHRLSRRPATVAGIRGARRRSGDSPLLSARLVFGARPAGRAVESVRRYSGQLPRSTSLPLVLDLLEHDARGALQDIGVPCLVLVGSRDVLTPVRAARRIAALVPGARLEVLSGAGHMLMQERPSEVAQLIDELVSALPPVSALRGGVSGSGR